MEAKRVTKEFAKDHYFDASISRWVRNSDGAALYEHGYGPPNPERQKGRSLLLTEHSTGCRIDEVKEGAGEALNGYELIVQTVCGTVQPMLNGEAGSRTFENDVFSHRLR
jgi:hypothetical protein